MVRYLLLVIPLLLSSLLLGCGGGAGESNSSEPTEVADTSVARESTNLTWDEGKWDANKWN